MTINVVNPSDIAPAGFLKGDPDAAAAFTPQGDEQGQGSEQPTPVEPGADPEVDRLRRLLGDARYEEPPRQPKIEPPPPRPAVRYLSDNTISYPLTHPVMIGERTVRRVKIGHLALWDVQDWLANRIKTHFELIARMIDLDATELGALKWPDVLKILDLATDLMPDFVRIAIEQQKRTP